MAECLSFSAAVAEAIKRDVLLMHVDCGAFTPHRWNPDLNRLEYWSSRDDSWVSIPGSPDYCCSDWVVTDLKRATHEKIIYE